MSLPAFSSPSPKARASAAGGPAFLHGANYIEIKFHCQYYRKRISLLYITEPSSIPSRAGTKPCLVLGKKEIPRSRNGGRARHRRGRRPQRPPPLCRPEGTAPPSAHAVPPPRRGLPERRSAAPRRRRTGAPNAEDGELDGAGPSHADDAPENAFLKGRIRLRPVRKTRAGVFFRRHASRISSIS